MQAAARCCSCSSRPSRSITRRSALLCSLLLFLISHYIGLVQGECPVPKGASRDFLDPATPGDQCKKSVCVASYKECCGADPNKCVDSGLKEDLQLVFSDEFSSYGSAGVGGPGDVRWTAMDYHYSSDKNELQNYKPENVVVDGEKGELHLIMENKTSTATRHGAQATDLVTLSRTSGMVQSWNKFCFTGGYIEFSVKLPGNAQDSGFWAATWIMGNLGRAGYYPSLEGIWPFSYDACTDGSKGHEWNNYKTQRITRCNGTQGRGAPEIDVLEYGKLGSPARPTYVHTMQMGPVTPPWTSWLSADRLSAPGVSLPGRATPFETALPSYSGSLSRAGFPRPGSNLTDTYSGSSHLDGDPEKLDSYFTKHHNYAVLWEPGEYVRWYLDDMLLFEVGKEALSKKTSPSDAPDGAGLTVEQRLIPKEPSYLIMNLAMSDRAWAKVDPDLEYPATMSVDHVRIWQRPGAINVGCDPPGYPTSQYISCNRDLYMDEAEKPLWKFAYCENVASEENRFLLGVAVSCVVVTLVSMMLMLLMRRSYALEQKMSEQVGRDLPEGLTPGRTPQEKIKGCYLNKAGPELQEVLKLTRPDLIAVAEARQRQAS